MTLNNKRLVIFLFIFFFGFMLVRYIQRVPKRNYCDFRVYHHTAQNFLAGNEIYNRDSEAITTFRYSPFFAFVFSPLGLLPIKVAAAIFFLINFLATLALFWMIRKILVNEPLSDREGIMLYLLSFVFAFRLILLNWDTGQVVIVMAMLVIVSLYCLLQGKNLGAGALLSAAILVKYTPVIFIPYLILRKKYKAAVWTVVFLGVWLLLPALFVGIQNNFSYLSSWIPSIVRDSLDNFSYYDYNNYSIFSIVLRFIRGLGEMNIIDLSFRFSMWIAYIVLGFFYSLALLPRRGKDTFKIDCALLFIFMAFFNPNAWLLNYVTLILPCFLLVHYLIRVRLNDKFVLTCLILSFIFIYLFSRGLGGAEFKYFGSKISEGTIAAFFLMGALVKLKFSKESKWIN